MTKKIEKLRPNTKLFPERPVTPNYREMSYDDLYNESRRLGEERYRLMSTELKNLDLCPVCKAVTGKECKTKGGNVVKYSHSKRAILPESLKLLAEANNKVNIIDIVLRDKKQSHEQSQKIEAEKKRQERMLALVNKNVEQSLVVGYEYSEYSIIESENIALFPPDKVSVEDLKYLLGLGVGVSVKEYKEKDYVYPNMFPLPRY